MCKKMLKSRNYVNNEAYTWERITLYVGTSPLIVNNEANFFINSLIR